MSIDLSLEEFIKIIIDKRPSMIYNFKIVNIFLFSLVSPNGDTYTIKTNYDLTTSFNDKFYDIETFLKMINITQRRDKILKLKEKWTK